MEKTAEDAQYILKSTHVYSKPHDTVLNYMNMQLFFFFFSKGPLPQLL